MKPENYVDYYQDLQVSQNADCETIERVYRLLAKKYHPDNKTTGNSEKFNIITHAYRVLSDPEKRAAFDIELAGYQGDLFRVKEDAESSLTGDDNQIRNTILSILYAQIRKDTAAPGVGLWQLEKLIGWPEKILEFHIWYLKGKELIRRCETGGYEITVKGVDVVENSGKKTEKKNLLTYEE